MSAGTEDVRMTTAALKDAHCLTLWCREVELARK